MGVICRWYLFSVGVYFLFFVTLEGNVGICIIWQLRWDSSIIATPESIISHFTLNFQRIFFAYINKGMMNHMRVLIRKAQTTIFRHPDKDIGY